MQEGRPEGTRESPRQVGFINRREPGRRKGGKEVAAPITKEKMGWGGAPNVGRGELSSIGGVVPRGQGGGKSCGPK